MDANFITKIDRIVPFSEIKAQQGGQAEIQGSLFSNIFENAINDVTQTQKALEHEQYLLATGQSNNPHAITIAASEAQLTVDMLVQLRNKALDAYNELMRTGL